MKRVFIILGLMIIGVIALLENTSKNKKRITYTPDHELEYDEVWWDN